MHTVSIFFTQEEVDKFGELTGDNGPVHSVDGVVQGGFIISRLSKWLSQVKGNPVSGYEHSVSAMLDVKFRKKLLAGHQAYIEFDFNDTGGKLGKIIWRVFDSEHVYCNGEWIVFKVKH
jgi:hypothetical protein